MELFSIKIRCTFQLVSTRRQFILRESGFSGEFGHFCMFENEVLCHCGKKGCLETEASGSAFHRILIERYREGSNTILAGKLDSGEEISLGDQIGRASCRERV